MRNTTISAILIGLVLATIFVTNIESGPGGTVIADQLGDILKQTIGEPKERSIYRGGCLNSRCWINCARGSPWWCYVRDNCSRDDECPSFYYHGMCTSYCFFI